jgi:hypothetical protein
MSDTIRCPDCGFENPPGNDHCDQCNFPFEAHGESHRPGRPAGSAAPPAEPRPHEEGAVRAPRSAGGGAAPRDPSIPRPLARRARPRPGAMPAQALNLWLWMGGLVAVIVIFTAINFRHEESKPVEGSNPEQQKRANELAQALARDSTDIGAHVELGNLLYDTANWPEAIVHYRAALRRDSTIVNAIVDLGVCYYNLSVPDEAERLFRRALTLAPHQPIALFNLGIVSERRGDLKEALDYFQHAAENAAPTMQGPLQDAIERVRQKLGASGPAAPPAGGGASR